MSEGRITISRISNMDDGYIEIRMDDLLSSITFVIAKLDYENFAKLITGQGFIPCELKTIGLDRIGKKMEHKKFEFEMPPSTYGTLKKVAIETVIALCPEGWIPDCNFDSQSSFFMKDGKEYAMCTIRRWI